MCTYGYSFILYALKKLRIPSNINMDMYYLSLFMISLLHGHPSSKSDKLSKNYEDYN